MLNWKLHYKWPCAIANCVLPEGIWYCFFLWWHHCNFMSGCLSSVMLIWYLRHLLWFVALEHGCWRLRVRTTADGVLHRAGSTLATCGDRSFLSAWVFAVGPQTICVVVRWLEARCIQRRICRTFVYTYIHVYIHSYIHRCMHACMHAYIHTYIHTHYLHLHTFTYIYIHLHTFTYIYIHLHTFTYIYIHLHTFTYIYIHLHTFTYIYIHFTYIYIHFHTYI